MSRAPRSKLRTAPPSVNELILAARELHNELGRLLRDVDRKGAEAWEVEVRQGGRAPRTRATLQSPSGLVQAIRAYAERSTLERNRKHRGHALGRIALAAARGRLTEIEIIRQAKKARGDGQPIGEFSVEVERARGERAKWRAAYNVLAMDADVWPLPDIRRGARGQLKVLYDSLVRSKA